jgi:hypothetical protein
MLLILYSLKVQVLGSSLESGQTSKLKEHLQRYLQIVHQISPNADELNLRLASYKSTPYQPNQP